MRFNTTGDCPPNHNGMGRCTGKGLIPAHGDGVERARIVDELLSPELTHQLDLLDDALSAIGEARTERLELELVPTDANAEPQTATTQHVDLGGLLREQQAAWRCGAIRIPVLISSVVVNAVRKPNRTSGSCQGMCWS